MVEYDLLTLGEVQELVWQCLNAIFDTGTFLTQGRSVLQEAVIEGDQPQLWVKTTLISGGLGVVGGVGKSAVSATATREASR